MTIELIEGDCREVLKEFANNSIDSVVTDPPYGLSFMGKSWDYQVPQIDVWSEVFRVLKPGGHLLSFFGTRTYHRGVIPIEDAGFEIRDQIGWLYGSGFPKSSNQDGEWEGWGTALKPAWEPIVVARKPLIGTMAANLAAHGVGALNIDGCRVETNDSLGGGAYAKASTKDLAAASSFALGANAGEFVQPVGRWPANVIHDGSDEVLDAFPQAKGQIAKAAEGGDRRKDQNVYGVMTRGSNGAEPRDEGGSAARFFYCAKASKKDRGEGNVHPTVKPTDLMRYLVRLVTPPNGMVLDPFMGSGSTGRGAVLEGFNFIGIEMSTEYMDIADARIAAAEAQVAPVMRAAE